LVTSDDVLYEKISKLRNHGLKNRDEVEILGYNSRLDTLQAIVGNWLIKDSELITNKRVSNGKVLDDGLSKIPQIRIPTRFNNRKLVFHLYIVFAENRNELFHYCIKKGIEVKVHYPIPLYLQEGLKFLGHEEGDFPVTDRHAQEMISFPMHQHHTVEQMQYIVETVEEFYKTHAK
jgi:dTDP-4-amino-4,6-dideoxygalactose transaminase